MQDGLDDFNNLRLRLFPSFPALPLIRPSPARSD